MKPIILVSKCLTFDKCRYSAQIIPDKFVEMLKPYVEFIPVCPEVGIGLPVPRKQLTLYTDQLIEHKTNRNLTKEMNEFSEKFLSKIKNLDACIFMSKSPTCSIYSAKVFDEKHLKSSHINGSGLFARKVIKKFPNTPKEERGRLKNYSIRNGFLTRIFLLKNFKERKSLEEFQRKNKFLLMSFDRDLMKKMGQLVTQKKDSEYEELLYKLLQQEQKESQMVDVLIHIYGFFKEKVSDKEKKYILDLIQEYKKGKAPKSEILGILKDWAIRFDDRYILDQTIFEPFPKELELITDSGKGRDI